MRAKTEIDPKAVRVANIRFGRSEPQAVLEYALSTWSPRIAISTAFGVEGCALIDMAVRIDPKVQVFTVDTGLLFDETQALKAGLVERYGIEITTFESKLSLAEQEREHGPRLWERNSVRCCGMRKVEPTRRALSGLDCWIAGLRRDQSMARAEIDHFELHHPSEDHSLVKVHPFAHWTRDDTWRYVIANNVPYNPLLDQGYKSLGCVPCTRAVAADEPERAGRWNGDKSECGIHTFSMRV